MTPTKSQTKQLESIRQKHQLQLILLHGSQAKGQTHSNSDLDIAIYGRSKTLNLLKLISQLSETFPGQKVDVSNLTNADPLLLQTVTTKSHVLSGKQKDFDKLQLKAFHRYNDYQPYLKQEQQFVQSKLTP